jgi:hypothetical protein
METKTIWVTEVNKKVRDRYEDFMRIRVEETGQRFLFPKWDAYYPHISKFLNSNRIGRADAWLPGVTSYYISDENLAVFIEQFKDLAVLEE